MNEIVWHEYKTMSVLCGVYEKSSRLGIFAFFVRLVFLSIHSSVFDVRKQKS